MRLIYPVKIEYKEGAINSLISPDLRVDFVNDYVTQINKDITADHSLKELNADNLIIVIENYIKFIQENNYILRLPDQSQHKCFSSSEHWINIELNISVQKGNLEHFSKIFSISLLIANSIVFEFQYILSSRLSNVPYISLIFPVIADLIMNVIVYIYSGSISNMAEKGKEFDDWYSKKESPTEVILINKNPLLSSINMAKLLLLVPPLTHAILRAVSYGQSMISMGEKLEKDGLDDAIMSPKLIYNVGIVGAIIVGVYNLIQYTSFSFKATYFLKNVLDQSYVSFRSKTTDILKRNNFRRLSANEETELDEDTEIELTSDLSNNKNVSDIQTHTIFFINEVLYENLLLNIDGLLLETLQIGGLKAAQNIISLGENSEVSNIIIECINQKGVKYLVKVLFEPITIGEFQTSISNNQAVEIYEPLDIEKNFFLKNAKGKHFIQDVTNHFDESALLTILELGKDYDIAEQIIDAAEFQGIDRVVYTLLGKEIPEAGSINNLENIISTDELNQLQLVPNGILNSWSNNPYLRVVEYIDNLAKNLDSMLNVGKSGNQVAIIITLLEEWINFAASGQRLVSMPYFYHGNDGDYPYSGGSGSGGENYNNSAENFALHQGFITTAIMPLYNETYNITDYQM